MKLRVDKYILIALFSITSFSKGAVVSLVWENDVLFKTDYYYSQGVALGFEHKSFAIPLVCKKIFPASVNDSNYSGNICLNNAIYTPQNIRQPVPDIYDAPYAGLTWLSLSQSGFSGNYLGTCELQLGVLGSASLSEEFQKFIHEVTDNPAPQGWDYQLSNGPIVNVLLSANRIKWLSNKRAYGMLGTDIRLGTIHTDFNLRFRVGGGFGLDAFGFSGS
ncbi:MAG: lipid A deacylase LpxR family protein, partial [Fibrobacteres bacterium]|nr:lipid A deacylase LpxR family protein [Fibrobacterota bacterium]